MCVAHVVATLASKKPGEASKTARLLAEEAGAPAAEEGPRKSFLQSFQQSGGSAIFFVGCDCGTAGCVIFDQGKETVCRPVKKLKH